MNPYGRLKHGYRIVGKTHPLYWRWQGMIQRCINPNNRGWRWYGAEGITVCKRWRDFPTFLADMGSTWKRGLTLERKNRRKGYYPRNVYWDTWEVQRKTRRISHPVKFLGETRSLPDWCRRFGIKYTTVVRRLGKGWNLKRALTFPLRGHA